MKNPTAFLNMLATAALLVANAPALAQTAPQTANAALQKAHQHGQVQAGVAVQGQRLSVQLEIPLDSLLGFEHRPRNSAERAVAQAALQALKAAAAWLKPDAAAQCTLARSDIDAQALEPATPGRAEQGHADVDASYEFNCAAPDKLAGLDIGLMAVFKRIQRLDVQVAGAKTQSQQTLHPPATRVRLRP